MARTLDPAAHALRRDEFVDAAQRLIAAKGYEALSIQDLLDDLGASKGAFYHYFGSKSDLLGAVVDRMVDGAYVALQPIVDDPNLTGLEKFEHLFSGLADFKTERRDFLLALMEVWYSDGNTMMREQLRRGMVVRMGPLFAQMARQGHAEGTFHLEDPDRVGDVIVSLTQGINEFAGRQYLEYRAGAAGLDTFLRTLTAYAIALDRILGLPDGTLTIGDPAVLRQWFV